MYRVRGADQNEYGPIPADVVRQWFRSRRLIASSLIQLEGTSEWKALRSFPEFADLLNEAQPPGPPPLNLPSAKPPETSSLATSSLVLGILGFFTCGITAVIGLVLGITSTIRIKRHPERLKGKRLAMSGIIISSIALVLGSVVAPAIFKQVKGKSESVNCLVNLKQISLAARMYAMDHNNTFPPDFLALSNGLVSPKVLVCNADFGRMKADDWARIGSRNISYEYLVAGRKESDVAQMPAFRCPVHGHVILGDSTVQEVRKQAQSKRKP